MASITALKQVGGAPANVPGTGNPTHTIRWKAEYDGPVSGAEAIILAQNTADGSHDPVAKLGDPFTQLGYTDFGAQALDIDAQPQSENTSSKWDITVVFRPPDPGSRETQADIAFFRWLGEGDGGANQAQDFTSIAELQAHDAQFPFERWVEFQQYDSEIDIGFRVQDPTLPPDQWVLEETARPIRNLLGDPFPNSSRYADSLVRLILVTERFVGSPISALWLGSWFARSHNADPFEISRLGKTFGADPGYARFLEARTGQLETYSNKSYYRCRSEVEIGDLFDITFARFEQRGPRARNIFDGSVVDLRTLDISGVPVPTAALKPDGFIADDPADQAPDDVWALNAPIADYQSLVGPAPQPTAVWQPPESESDQSPFVLKNAG